MTSKAASKVNQGPRQRLRDLCPDLKLGRYRTGKLNSITDVPGVLVHTESINKPNSVDEKTGEKIHAINTGVTVILPRKEWFHDGCYAGIFRFNGSGELTGSHWIEETGLLHSPVVLTNSFGVGACYDGIYHYAIKNYVPKQSTASFFLLPVVGETYDGHCNDIAAMPVKPEMTVRGIENASSERVEEGNTGGGTGMMCSGFKAGTGSASRIIDGHQNGQTTEWTIAALVQTNFGKKDNLTMCGVPIGRLYVQHEQEAAESKGPPKEGSIIVVIATSAPLSPIQLQRIAERATVGVARLGGWGSNSSGDVFIAFSTGVNIPRQPEESIWSATADQGAPVVYDQTMNALLEAAADVTEEAILNSICMAQTTEGPEGRRAEALPMDWLKKTIEEHAVTAPYLPVPQ